MTRQGKTFKTSGKTTRQGKARLNLYHLVSTCFALPRLTLSPLLSSRVVSRLIRMCRVVAYLVSSRFSLSGPCPSSGLVLSCLSLFLISILFLAGRVHAQTTPLPPLCHFRPENLHSLRGCPKKVEKTSSEKLTFEKSEHPYRTCGSSG